MGKILWPVLYKKACSKHSSRLCCKKHLSNVLGEKFSGPELFGSWGEVGGNDK